MFEVVITVRPTGSETSMERRAAQENMTRVNQTDEFWQNMALAYNTDSLAHTIPNTPAMRSPISFDLINTVCLDGGQSILMLYGRRDGPLVGDERGAAGNKIKYDTGQPDE